MLTLPKLTSVSGVNLNLNDVSNPQLFTSITGGVSFTLNAGTVAMPLTNLSGLTSISVSGTNSKLSFPNVTSYTQPANTRISWTAGAYSYPTYNTGCELDFPALTTVTGNLETTNSTSATMVVTAQYGATINFPVLTTITVPTGTPGIGSTDGIQLAATNSGIINAGSLTSFTDNSGTADQSSFSSSNSGVFTIPELTSLTGVNLNLGGAGMIALPIAGSLSGVVTVSGGQQISFPNITSINGVTQISVTGTGSTLSFPKVTSYTQPATTSVTWTVGSTSITTGCQLNFPALTTITAATTNYYFSITAQYGAAVSLPALTTITAPPNSVSYSNNGVRLAATNSGTLSAPLLNSFTDQSTGTTHYSSLTANVSGVLTLPKLTSVSGVNLNLDDVSNPQLFTSVTGGVSFTLNAGTVAMPLTNLNGLTSISVNGTNSKLSFPNLTSYTQPANTKISWTAGAYSYPTYNTGCELDFPALTTVTGNLETTNSTSATMVVTAQYGATINLPVLTTIAIPAGTPGIGSYDGIQLAATNSGIINAGALTSFTDNSGTADQSSLTTSLSGVLTVPQLTSLTGVSLNFSSSGSVVLAVTGSLSGSITVYGGAQLSFPNVTNINGVTTIYVYGTSSTLSFPSVTGYTQPASTSVTWTAGSSSTSTGCALSFPALTTITGTTTNYYFSVTAQYGAAVSLPALTTITAPPNSVSYSNNGVRLAATNSATLSAPLLNSFTDQSTGTAHYSSLTANVSGVLTLPKLTSVSGVNLNLNDVSNPQLFTSITGGVSFTLNAGTVAMPLTSLTGLTSISVNGTNSKLSFPNLTSYLQPANTKITWTAGAYSYPTYNTGCELDFPALKVLTGNLETTNSTSATMVVTAQYGATINFPVLTTITVPTGTPGIGSYDGIQLAATNSAIINAGALTSFTDHSGTADQSSLTTSLSGALTLPQLAALTDVNLNLSSAGPVVLSVAGSLTGVITVGGGAQISFPNITSINGVTQISVTGAGSTLTFPKVTGYMQPATTSVTWTAGSTSMTTGCQLSFPALKTITGTTTNYYFSVTAQYGAAFSLPALTTITAPPNSVSYSNNGVRLAATNSGTLSAPLLNSFTDQSTGTTHYSSLTANVSGVLTLPKLTSVNGVNLNLNDVSNPQLFTSITGGVSFTLNAGTVAMPLTNLNGLTSISVNGTNSKLSFPNVTSYTQPAGTAIMWTAGAYSYPTYATGCELDFPALTTLTGNLNTVYDTRESMVLTAQYGATINFPVLNTITVPAGTPAAYSYDGIQLAATNSGVINAEVLTSFTDNSGTADKSSLTANTSGSFSLPNLTSSGITGVTLSGVTLSNLKTFGQWESLYFSSSQLSNTAVGGAAATPQGDGIPNFLKYVYDINPSRPMSAADIVALPAVGTTTQSGAQYVTLTYRQYALIINVTKNIQTSSNLTTWQTVQPDFTQSLGPDPVTGDPIIEVGVKLNGASSLFIHLNATSP